MPPTPEYLKGTVAVEVLESHNKALARRKERDERLRSEVTNALKDQDWLIKLKRVWPNVGKTSTNPE